MYYSKETLQKVKQIDLLTYLQQADPSQLVKLSKGQYCTQEHDSLKISNGKWHWFSRGIGGRSALDYLIKVQGMSFLDAVESICSVYNISQIRVNYQGTSENSTKLIMPEIASNTDHVTAYLENRGILPDVIDFCLEHNLIFEAEKFHNAIFVGRDKTGKARYGAIRGTIGDFKQEVSGSNKRYSFCMNPGKEDLHLFEAAIDAMSFASLMELKGEEWREMSLLSLAGVYTPKEDNRIPRALEQYLVDYPNIHTIHLHLDNDEVGVGATDAIMKTLQQTYLVVDEPPEFGYKDINDELVARTSRGKEDMTR